MKNRIIQRSFAITLAGGLLATMLCATAWADSVGDGKKIAFDRKKGNCLACHMMGDGESPGDIGPPLVAMKARFPDRAKLRSQIWDATVANPESIMLPFGRHHIL
ncbi:MAG: sulfur oxidation c-type cytochrome SoxX, partial [Chromatiales bacterium]|nr:sulfur oxidation c-type cytochrome SoxX [Chromatiales bacterium]